LTTLIVDNTSPFSKNIFFITLMLKKKIVIERYSEININKIPEYDSIILSGRKKTIKETNIINTKIIKYCYQEDIPLLGICYGAEIINLSFGGSLIRMKQVMQGFKKITTSKECLSLPNNFSFLAYQSHGYAISKISRQLEILAASQNNKFEIFKHINKNILGFNFTLKKAERLA
jgi:GMP synthase (glutamine-hydrolysing)